MDVKDKQYLNFWLIYILVAFLPMFKLQDLQTDKDSALLNL